MFYGYKLHELDGNRDRLKILEQEFRVSRTTIWRRLKRAGAVAGGTSVTS